MYDLRKSFYFILLELKKELSLILLKEISNLLFVFKGYEFIKKIFIHFFFNFKFYLQKNWSNLIFVIYLFIFLKKESLPF